MPTPALKSTPISTPTHLLHHRLQSHPQPHLHSHPHTLSSYMWLPHTRGYIHIYTDIQKHINLPPPTPTLPSPVSRSGSYTSVPTPTSRSWFLHTCTHTQTLTSLTADEAPPTILYPHPNPHTHPSTVLSSKPTSTHPL